MWEVICKVDAKPCGCTLSKVKIAYFSKDSRVCLVPKAYLQAMIKIILRSSFEFASTKTGILKFTQVIKLLIPYSRWLRLKLQNTTLCYNDAKKQ